MPLFLPVVTLSQPCLVRQAHLSGGGGRGSWRRVCWIRESPHSRCHFLLLVHGAHASCIICILRTTYCSWNRFILAVIAAASLHMLHVRFTEVVQGRNDNSTHPFAAANMPPALGTVRCTARQYELHFDPVAILPSQQSFQRDGTAGPVAARYALCISLISPPVARLSTALR